MYTLLLSYEIFYDNLHVWVIQYMYMYMYAYVTTFSSTVPSSANLKIARGQTAVRLKCKRGWHNNANAVNESVQPQFLYTRAFAGSHTDAGVCGLL